MKIGLISLGAASCFFSPVLMVPAAFLGHPLDRNGGSTKAFVGALLVASTEYFFSTSAPGIAIAVGLDIANYLFSSYHDHQEVVAARTGLNQ